MSESLQENKGIVTKHFVTIKKMRNNIIIVTFLLPILMVTICVSQMHSVTKNVTIFVTNIFVTNSSHIVTLYVSNNTVTIPYILNCLKSL